MSCPESIALWVTIAILSISGIISNGFIVIIMIAQWNKCRSFSSSEQLFLILGLSNLGATVLMLPFWIDDFSVSSLTRNLVLKRVFPIAIFALISRFWLTALLCFFYCIKIVPNTQASFLWCKLRISWLLPKLLVGSLLFSCFTSLYLHFGFIDVKNNATKNMSLIIHGKALKDSSPSFRFFFLIFCSGSPLLIVALCSTLVIASLCRHICQMKAQENFRSLQKEAHIKAAGTVLSLLLLYILFFVAQTLSMTTSARCYEQVFIGIMMMIYSPAQAAILVLNNPKLKKALIVMVRRMKP